MAVSVFVDGKATDAQENGSLFSYAESVGVRVPTSCFEQGKCRECLVEVEEGTELLSPRSPEESALDDRFRLACRTRVIGEAGTLRCHTLRRSALRIEEDAVELEAERGNDGAQASADPVVRRDGDDVLRDGEVIASGPGPLLGLAIDVGTTTVVVRLHDLESGRLLATQSFENPQRFGGTDVMARIRFDTDNKGRLLQRTLLGYLTHAIEALPCDPERIFEVVIAANTTMRDLFFGLNVKSVGEYPYHSITETEMHEGVRETTSLIASPRKLHLPLNPNARVCGLPLVGGHVGADASAAMLATGIGTTEGTRVLMDIGTNTEVIIGNRTRLMAASCPAGPAFEGGAIRNGTPALDGAIERITIEPDGTVRSSTIGDGAPHGMCGSGLVDLLGELLRTGIMNELGRLSEHARIEFDDQDRPQFVVDAEHDIRLTEFDINELAQAKGANSAGLRAVLDLFGIEAGDIERFYLAGGFARHLDIDATRRIGLIPDLPNGRIVRVGNAALEGASLALNSSRRRAELETRVREVEHVSLETHERFFDFFVEGCQFTRFTS